jgi:hypothetical protein
VLWALGAAEPRMRAGLLPPLVRAGAGGRRGNGSVAPPRLLPTGKSVSVVTPRRDD